MNLSNGLHLAYCTNVHRGETWAETFDSLQTCTLAVKQRVCPQKPYGIGLRLSHRAAQELNEPETIREFHHWLDEHGCYVFTINGFPFGRFHGAPVKEQVYKPDWTTPERLAYTNLLFDILSRLVPPEVEGSVSTLPGSFKEFIAVPEEVKQIRDNLWHCVQHIERVCHQTGRKLHLGLEPEPLCLLEATGEVIHYFDRMRAEHRNDPRLDEFLGVNYDTCHLAVEFENPQEAVACLAQHGIKLSKIHLSSALKVSPTPEAREALRAFAEDVYLHQVVALTPDGQRVIYRDLGDALSAAANVENPADCEWRIHFHVPLHCEATALFGNTADHLLGVLDVLARNPGLCTHLEMETYTWEVLPPDLKDRDVVDQLVSEYEWTLARLRERGMCE